MKRGERMFRTYVQKMGIDFIAFPIEKSGKVFVALIEPEHIAQAIANDFPVVERRKGELFFRMKRQYSPIKVLPYLKPTHLIETGYKRVKDFPVHAGMKSRGFEIVVSEAVNGTHVGDNINSADVTQTVYGHIECKIGGGRLYYAGK